MKTRIINKMMAAFIVIFGLSGCYKDVTSPGTDPNGPPAFVSFSGDLIPLFNDNCNATGCHDGSHAPDLRPDKAYNAIKTGGWIDLVVPNNSILYQEVKTGGMPPAGALSSSQAQQILDWVRNGAPNN